MIFLIKIGIFILNIIYCIFKIFPTKNKITFISRQNNYPSVDFSLLKDEFNKVDKTLEIVMLCRRLEKGLLNKIKYIFHMFVQMYHIATSKVVLLDSYSICVSVLKHKKRLKIIQMWHAMGAFKKFGYSILDQKEGSSNKIAKVMKMHRNYDYVFTSSEKCKKYFADAFDVSLDKMVVMPLPSVDLITSAKFIKNNKKKVLEKYPDINEKEVILYAPTFRKSKSMVDDIKKLINEINFNKYNLVIKLHPLSNNVINDKRVIFDTTFTTLEMASVSDYVVTDYSAVVYEMALLNKPLFFYNYDIEEYMDSRNFYIDFEKELPGIISNNSKKIIRAIETNKYDLKSVRKFALDNVSFKKGSCTKNIVMFILNLL